MNRPSSLPEDQIEAWQQAMEFLQEGIQRQQSNDLTSAIAKYRLSLAFYPTPEAHTYLGWAYAALDLYAEAIDECKRAIALDPEYGNPYNDIGAYLLENRNYAEAVPWLEKAIAAPRYDSRHFPFFNLGQVYEHLGDWPKAIRHYRQALDLAPEFEEARRAWQNLQAKLN